MTGELKTTDVRRALAGLVREDVTRAAGADQTVSTGERYELSSLPRAAATALGDGALAKDAIVDRAMASAAELWSRHGAGAGSKTLSNARMLAIQADDATIGLWTRSAAEIVRNRRAPRGDAPRVSLLRATPGLRLSHEGDEYTISATSRVPVGATFELIVDQHRFELSRAPGGIDAQRVRAPEGYGAELLSATHGEGSVRAKLKVTKDPAGSLTTDAARAKAREGLADYLRATRMHDADWKAYFPEGWDEAVARGMATGLEAFATAGAEGSTVDRKPDRYVFTGRGPFDLYTEVEVAKADGRPLRVLVEID